MKLSIIIPVYNEAETIVQTVAKACEAPLPGGVEREIIVVNDGSNDETLAALQFFKNHPLVRILSFKTNRGKTAAQLAGIQAARGNTLLFQDADLEYDPRHYQKLVEPVLQGKFRVVFGSRFLGEMRGMNPFIRLANQFNTWSVNQLYAASLTDVNTGYKVISKELFDQIPISSGRFGGDAELTARLLKRGEPIQEIAIDYQARRKKAGKKMNSFSAIHMYFCFFFLRTVR